MRKRREHKALRFLGESDWPYPAEWFLWRGYDGYTRLDNPQRRVSWSTWRQTVNQIPQNSVPQILIENSQWLLPFALTYPHRVTRELSGAIDVIFGERADLV
jgi:hypothetical protein